MMRIVVVETNGNGGMVHFAYQMCTGLARSGADVILVTAEDYELAHLPHEFRVDRLLRLWSTADPERVASEAGPGRLYTIRRRFRRIGRAFRFAWEWGRLVSHIRTLKPDVVQFGIIHFPFQWIYFRQLRRAGLMLSQICHEFDARDMRDVRASGMAASIGWWLYQKVYDQFSAILFLAEKTRTEFLERIDYPLERTRVVPHGIQTLFESEPAQVAALRTRYGLGGDEPVILFFGTVRPSKGIEDLLEAFARLRERGGARLLIVGFPNKHADVEGLRRRAEALGIMDATVFDLRYVPNEEIGSILALASIYVLPYRNATQSGALYLGFSHGVPIVATDVGGLGEDVEDGVTGLLVPPASPDDLAAALQRLLDAPSLARRLGEEGKRWAERQHSWAAAAEAVLDSYRTIGAVRGGEERAVADEQRA